MAARTIADADDYWNRYYHDTFIPGLGTEHILAALRQVPPRDLWLDLGAGSESLLWSVALDAHQLVAVDLDPLRLTLLRRYATSRRPRGAHQTALALCARDAGDFARRCERLTATIVADCLTGQPLPLHAGCADLITQIGLLGLAGGHEQFLAAWTAAHQPLAPGGWTAGANWNATRADGRVRLSAELYAAAFSSSGLTAQLLRRVPISGDPDFDAVWIYLGRRP